MSRKNRSGKKDGVAEDAAEVLGGAIIGAGVLKFLEKGVLWLLSKGGDAVVEKGIKRFTKDERARLLEDMMELRKSNPPKGENLWKRYQECVNAQDGSEDVRVSLLIKIHPSSEADVEGKDEAGRKAALEEVRKARLHVLEWLDSLSKEDDALMMTLLEHDAFAQFVNRLGTNFSKVMQSAWGKIKLYGNKGNAKLGELADEIHNLRQSVKEGNDIEQGLRSVAQKLREFSDRPKESGAAHVELKREASPSEQMELFI